jgi:hypothetical protein
LSWQVRGFLEKRPAFPSRPDIRDHRALGEAADGLAHHQGCCDIGNRARFDLVPLDVEFLLWMGRLCGARGHVVG